MKTGADYETITIINWLHSCLLIPSGANEYKFAPDAFHYAHWLPCLQDPLQVDLHPFWHVPEQESTHLPRHVFKHCP